MNIIINETMTFNRVLTQEEIRMLFNNGKPLITWYRLKCLSICDKINEFFTFK